MTVDVRTELGRRANSNEKVLDALRRAGGAGLLNAELDRIALRYGARLFELRGDGWDIRREHVAGGLWRYTLIEPDEDAEAVQAALPMDV